MSKTPQAKKVRQVSQEIAQADDIALATVGLEALIDEACGYGPDQRNPEEYRDKLKRYTRRPN